jgi:3-dehydroquinate synthase
VSEGKRTGLLATTALWSTVTNDVNCDGDSADAIKSVTKGRRLAMISDSNVMPLHGEPLAKRLGIDPADRFTVPAGEASKSREEWSRLTDAMLARGFGRDSAIVGVGGGMVGDLAGFVSATYMRGIPLVLVPTTLLSMVDASIGGKTGVDTPAGKNLVGAFHEATIVLADPAALRTLPKAEFRTGLAECVKHALITSQDELDWLRANTKPIESLDLGVLLELIHRNVPIKVRVVKRDMFESGLRKTLNFGHTIGHAIESVSNYAMLHGDCVAVGMIVEARIAVGLKLADASLVDRVRGAIETFGLPTHVPGQMASDAILRATRSDKKARGGAVEYALLHDVGQPAAATSGYGTSVPDAVVLAALDASR